MSPLDDGDIGSIAGFPRVSGDEPVEARLNIAFVVFSPRERG